MGVEEIRGGVRGLNEGDWGRRAPSRDNRSK